MNSQGKRTLHNEEEAYAWAAVGLKEHLPGEAMDGLQIPHKAFVWNIKMVILLDFSQFMNWIHKLKES